MRRLPISCLIITKNEEDRIRRTIASVRDWVDEIVVVDSGSTDATVAVAESEGAVVYTNPWQGFGQQKRFAETRCRNDWLFNIDADEVVTEELRDEILALFESGSPAFVAYGMPIELVYPGADKPRPWARDHWYVRLYDRRFVRFRESAVHDSVVTEDHPVGSLRGSIYHFSIRSFEHLEQKLDERTWLAINSSASRSALHLLPRLVTEIPVNFIKYYVTRRHFTGGVPGLHYAWLQAWYRFIKVRRMLHMNATGQSNAGADHPGGDNSQDSTHLNSKNFFSGASEDPCGLGSASCRAARLNHSEQKLDRPY